MQKGATDRAPTELETVRLQIHPVCVRKRELSVRSVVRSVGPLILISSFSLFFTPATLLLSMAPSVVRVAI